MVGQLPEPENGLTFWDATGGAAEKFLRLVDSFTIQYDAKPRVLNAAFRAYQRQHVKSGFERVRCQVKSTGSWIGLRASEFVVTWDFERMCIGLHRYKLCASCHSRKNETSLQARRVICQAVTEISVSSVRGWPLTSWAAGKWPDKNKQPS